MKKVLIVAVCLTLVLTLVFTLGALGKKPDKLGKPEYVNYDVTITGTDVWTNLGPLPCTGKHGVSTYRKPVQLELHTVKFGLPLYSSESGVYFELWENKNKGTITMGYWFWYPDKDTGEKLMLITKGDAPHDWLSLEDKFTVEFTATASITRTGNRVVWFGDVNITVVCAPQQ